MDTHKCKTAGAVVLGMHDAIVSLIGLIAGLTFANTSRAIIVLTAIIASVAAGLSMAASNYLAEKTVNNPHALRAGVITGLTYLTTCAFLILPCLVIPNTIKAMIGSFIVVVLIILGCNACICYTCQKKFWIPALEMLIVCTMVSFIAFFIGEGAKYFLGVAI